ncbi:putative Fibrillin-2 [Fasciola gigantica]|uniref:Putative Fibrillin-2 n=1 Tax=Fasciola gigantica TaxID=46835 RepID=A0A504Z027_FASGI|nr:putative Fibrillin-2 [Fasciola gigantica]
MNVKKVCYSARTECARRQLNNVPNAYVMRIMNSLDSSVWMLMNAIKVLRSAAKVCALIRPDRPPVSVLEDMNYKMGHAKPRELNTDKIKNNTHMVLFSFWTAPEFFNIDTDECANKTICGEGQCYNLEGTYECHCKQGYRFNGITCVQSDECFETQLQCENGKCENVDGKATCICNLGFQSKENTCIDIDECEMGQKDCAGYKCINLFGSVACECPFGYEYVDDKCTDIDECQVNNVNCGPGYCVNTPGNFYCQCKYGYKFNGKTCVEGMVG